ncbi:MAG: transcription elongation factor GreA [Bacteroidetes bacterium]|nr:transcription elongation factor GreA [Bacteroidota bacterium]
MANEVTYYSEEGLKKLLKELHRLKTGERTAIAQQIAEAREKGDLSENAEYKAAKEAQSMLETKISKMEEALSNARVMDKSQKTGTDVRILSEVKLKNLDNNSTLLYILVSESEADLKAGKISITSPIGKALLGKKKEDEVEVSVPSGKLRFKILDIK